MNYGKNGLKEQIRSASAKSGRKRTRAAVIIFKILLAGVLSLFVIAVSTGAGMFRGILKNAPDLNTLDMSPDASATIIYDADGKEMQTLVMAGSNRQPVEYSEIPQNLINAFVAIEDSRFWTHNGVDVKGMTRAVFSGLTTGDFDQGASTITQQLIKNVAFNGGAEKSFGSKIKRKIQEQYLAIQLEKTMDKKIILQNYLNTINLGANTLGVEAASERYFGKSVSELNLSECAVIAAITQNPTRYNPITNPDENVKRRNIVLEDMFEQGYITQEELRAAETDDVYVLIQEVDAAKSNESSVYSYFVDETIVQALSDLQEKAGYSETEARNLLYSGGLKIYTTQDSDLQKIVDEEISDPSNYSSAIQYSFSYRLSITHKDGSTDNYSEANIKSYLREKNGAAVKLIFDTEDEIRQYVQEFRSTVVSPEDMVQGERLDITLQPQGSCVLMEQDTGYVKAISGGRGEKTTSLSLNRATDSLRQPGSTFKVLTAFAPALDSSGATLGTVYYDSPYTLGDKTFSNWWQSGYVGYANIRDGITYSMNIVALKTMMNTVTPQLGYQYALDFGITSLVESEKNIDTGEISTDIGPSLCLGGITHGVSNLELTSAYAAVANKGVYTKPVYYTKILDSNGKILVDNEPETHTVIKESTAWLLTNAMEDVCETSYLYGRTDIRSSAPQAKVEGLPTAGKSGTTTASNDVWFVGYTPYYTLGLWQGYDENSPMSTGEDVKYMWHKIMSRACEELPEKSFPDMPGNIEQVSICRKSGKLAVPGICDQDPAGDMTYTEYFAKGTAPTEVCDHHVKVTVCSLSGSLATEFCPDSLKQTKIYRVLTGDASGITDDSAYLLPDALKNSSCYIHTGHAFPFMNGENETDNSLLDPGNGLDGTTPESSESNIGPPGVLNSTLGN
ncbi:transglycosylase domain-containing protein [Lacrimispora sp. NSJ-141]|uniref:Penicillin-binding protein 1A n=1 Tax=Lientehia hominis TaxID=2897778 RepID=A0AAP2W9M1_9FIRM|nr:transglycosylase domain-containing protein [Lientehia hominis]MCD2493451.1 transglycosylase domain-containing protein [Lientehia hominis]